MVPPAWEAKRFNKIISSDVKLAYLIWLRFTGSPRVQFSTSLLRARGSDPLPGRCPLSVGHPQTLLTVADGVRRAPRGQPGPVPAGGPGEPGGGGAGAGPGGSAPPAPLLDGLRQVLPRAAAGGPGPTQGPAAAQHPERDQQHPAQEGVRVRRGAGTQTAR